MVHLYLDKSALQQMYIVKGYSMSKIGYLLGCGRVVVSRELQRCQIPIRLRKVNEGLISVDAVKFLEGELLGDGCVVPCKSGNCYFSWGMKHEKYVLWLAEQLKKYNIKTNQIITHVDNDPRFKVSYITYRLKTSTYRDFRQIRDRWYPFGKKIVPDDLEFTPTCVRQWFLGDGCLYKRKYGWTLAFATYCFSEKDVNKLIKKFSLIGIESSKQKGPVLNILSKSMSAFYNYIGLCPKEIQSVYGYKWKYVETFRGLC